MPVAPMIHTNGTSKKELVGKLETAVAALYSAIEGLQGTAPHARDYYLQSSDAYGMAKREHDDRMDRLTSVRAELQEIWEQLEG